MTRKIDLLALAAGLSATLGAATLPGSAFAVAPCTSNCATLTVGSASAGPGQTASVPVSFTQAPPNGQNGGPDEVAAVAFTLNLSNNDSVPLTLANCTIGSDGLPASVRPAAALSNFRVVVENASCTGKTHCLCPEEGSGTTRDNFVNVVVYGPNPLPTPGPGPIDIPALPSGQLFTIDLQVAGSASGSLPLHVLNEVDDTEKPSFRAFLSIGDRDAVDQTCVPEQGVPPCSGANPVSQITVAHGSVTVEASCVGDCNASSDVTVDEIVTMVNIALGNNPVESCRAGDANSDAAVTVDEIILALNNALNGCRR